MTTPSEMIDPKEMPHDHGHVLGVLGSMMADVAVVPVPMLKVMFAASAAAYMAIRLNQDCTVKPMDKERMELAQAVKMTAESLHVAEDIESFRQAYDEDAEAIQATMLQVMLEANPELSADGVHADLYAILLLMVERATKWSDTLAPETPAASQPTE